MEEGGRIGVGVDGDGFAVGHPVVAGAAAADQVDREGSIAKFEMGENG